MCPSLEVIGKECNGESWEVTSARQKATKV
jgi:hypothetical protein